MQGFAFFALIFLMLIIEVASRVRRPRRGEGPGRQAQPRPLQGARDRDNWATRLHEQLMEAQKRAQWERPGGQQWRPIRPGQRPSQPPRSVTLRWSETQGQETASPLPGGAAEETGDYLGSMGHASEEGVTMHDSGSVLGSLGLTLLDDAAEDEGPGSLTTGPIAAALSALHSTADPSAGAGAAIVLAEILGPPRAIRRAGPGGAGSRRK